MRGTRAQVWARVVVALCLAVLGLSATAAADSEKRVPKCAGQKATIVGTGKADRIKGTRKKDVIVAKGGNDRIRGRGGADVICAGPGDDTVDGGPAADQVRGDAGADVVLGGSGPDVLDGGSGDDTADGGPGADRLLGGQHTDRLSDASAEPDALVGGDDVDVCTLTAGDAVDCEFDPADPVVFVPHQGTPSSSGLDVAGTAAIPALDLYVLLDRSGSMTGEINNIKSNLASVVAALTCAPAGSGSPPNCIEDLWAGAGTLGYTGSGAQTYANHVDLQPNPNLAGVPTTEPSGCCMEPMTFAVWASITGNGGAAYGYSVPPRSTCTGSPASNVGYSTFGYPCFRGGALPVVLLVTDEAPLSGPDTWPVPNWMTIVVPAMTPRSARLVGVYGTGSSSTTIADLRSMASSTGAVDMANGAAPIVVSGADATAATAIQNAMLTLAHGAPLDVSAVPVDNPADGVDAVTAFAARVQTAPTGSAACATATAQDTDADGFEDTYLDTVPGTGLCWRLVVKPNTTVPAAATDQVFHATVEVTLAGVGKIEQRDVYFVVPHL